MTEGLLLLEKRVFDEKHSIRCEHISIIIMNILNQINKMKQPCTAKWL